MTETLRLALIGGLYELQNDYYDSGCFGRLAFKQGAPTYAAAKKALAQTLARELVRAHDG